MANAGGAWDNAKKIVETELKMKNTPLHAATVVGDTVGDPFKDTSSVALNPVIKFTTLFGLLAVELAVQPDARTWAIERQPRAGGAVLRDLGGVRLPLVLRDAHRVGRATDVQAAALVRSARLSERGCVVAAMTAIESPAVRPAGRRMPGRMPAGPGALWRELVSNSSRSDQVADVSLTLFFGPSYNRPLCAAASDDCRRKTRCHAMNACSATSSTRPSSSGTSRATRSLLTIAHRGGGRRGDRHHSADGGRHAADAAVDDGVRGGAAAAAATAAAATAAAAGRGAEAGGGREPERGADRGADGNQAGSPVDTNFDRASASKAAFPAASSAASSAGCPKRRRRRPPPPAQPVRVGGQIKPPTKTKHVQPDVSADRAVGARPGRRHHRGDDRHRTARCRTRGCSARFRCSTRRRSTPCGSGSSRRRCSTTYRCRSS